MKKPDTMACTITRAGAVIVESTSAAIIAMAVLWLVTDTWTWLYTLVPATVLVTTTIANLIAPPVFEFPIAGVLKVSLHDSKINMTYEMQEALEDLIDQPFVIMKIDSNITKEDLYIEN